MKNKTITDPKSLKTFTRISRKAVANHFRKGETIYVLTIDRDPVTSLTEPFKYDKGCKPYFLEDRESINTFEDIVEDFSAWLEGDGYGHVADAYKAQNQVFSYWVEG